MNIALGFVIAERSLSHNQTAVACFRVQGSLYLAAAILGVPLVNDILERCKFVITVVGINPVIDSDKPDIVLRKEYFGVISRLQIFSSKSGQVLHNNSTDFPDFNILYHTLEIGTFKIRSAEAIVNVKDIIGKPVVLRILRKIGFLILYAHTLAADLIITAESAIDCC